MRKHLAATSFRQEQQGSTPAAATITSIFIRTNATMEWNEVEYA